MKRLPSEHTFSAASLLPIIAPSRRRILPLPLAPPRLHFIALAASFYLFPSSLAAPLSPSLSTSKLSITLAADNLDRFELSSCLPEYPLQIPAAPISEICALVSTASLLCAQSSVEFSKDYFATPKIAVTAYMLISTH